MARFVVGLLSLSLLISTFALAQDDADQAVGLPAHGSFSGSNFDSVQLNNGNLHIEIPLFSLPGRGLSTTVKLVYDSKGWYGRFQGPPPDAPMYIDPRGTPGGPPTAGKQHGMDCCWSYDHLDSGRRQRALGKC